MNKNLKKNVIIEKINLEEILYKQMELLAERSKECLAEELPSITTAMVEIYKVISKPREQNNVNAFSEQHSLFTQNEINKSMDINETAEYLGISKELLYKMCAQKLIPHTRLGDENSKKARIIFRYSSIEAWRDEQEKNNYIG
ncbi:helix-turn-helix domain-containing protein [Paenibacillus nuruki]|uniref:helix-turn-helix domain-containing protein n=1 Tax=Paenibacillus nuruki TaxID=1886670 RepID=UPI002804537A|nr:helix-turn-helix domain-containing protein [Paenibacillus nuruki]CAJ1315960.1 hypothetical protein AASFL403_12110 [Paenibacillus nuruki]